MLLSLSLMFLTCTLVECTWYFVTCTFRDVCHFEIVNVFYVYGFLHFKWWEGGPSLFLRFQFFVALGNHGCDFQLAAVKFHSC